MAAANNSRATIVKLYETIPIVEIKNMKKIFILLLALCAVQFSKAQVEIPRQEIAYNVNYHWGLVDVMIARGIVTVETDGNIFYGTLDGTSIPWEGKIICVSDTLRAEMGSYNGDLSETVLYQNGWYRRPSVSSFRSACYNPDDPAIYKSIAGQGEYDASNDSMEAIAVTSDMIGMYYFAHLLDFNSFKPGTSYTIRINGPYSNEVVITYQGEGIYSVDGDNYPTYNCTFEYSYGGRLSGYPVECKIGVNNRIPMFLSANLPVGRVEMLYDPE